MVSKKGAGLSLKVAVAISAVFGVAAALAIFILPLGLELAFTGVSPIFESYGGGLPRDGRPDHGGRRSALLGLEGPSQDGAVFHSDGHPDRRAPALPT